MKRTTITLKIDHYDDGDLPKDARFVISASNPEYRGIVEAGSGISDAIQRFGEAVSVRERFFKTRPAGREIKKQ